MSLVIGVPREIKDNENRVSVVPDGAAELVHHGHRVLVQSGAGDGLRAFRTRSTRPPAPPWSRRPTRCSTPPT